MSSATLGSERAKDTLDPVMHLVATVIEVAGVTIIVVGVLIASALFARRGYRSSDWEKAYEGFRADLGRGILLGLEFLVAADIIGTVFKTGYGRRELLLALLSEAEDLLGVYSIR